METLLFFFLAAFALTCAVMMVLQRNPIMSALCLIGNFFALAALYLLLRAQLLAVLQIVVYTGAIMVLVIFVIMLLNLGDERRLAERLSWRAGIGVALLLGFFAEIAYLFTADGLATTLPREAAAVDVGTAEAMGKALFGKFLLPFEITSLLLLAAIVGAVILARKRVS